MKRILTLMAALALTGCVNFEAERTAWGGKNLDELVTAWGPPTSVGTLSDGRQMVGYTHNTIFQGVPSKCQVWMVADKQGTILETKQAGPPNVACNQFFRARGY